MTQRCIYDNAERRAIIVSGETPTADYYARFEIDSAGGYTLTEAWCKLPTSPSRPKPRPKRKVIRPGTWLEHAIAAATLGLVRSCTACSRRKRRLDALGWRGLALAPWSATWHYVKLALDRHRQEHSQADEQGQHAQHEEQHDHPDQVVEQAAKPR